MREIRALVWKEWHETRLFLWIAWGLLIGLPIIGGIEGTLMFSQPFRFYAYPWVMILTPLLAIVVGVAGTCRDLQPRLEDFWQSRPMGGIRLFCIKYFVGVTVILLACGVPLAIEFYAQQKFNSQQSGKLPDMVWAWIALSLLLLPLFSMAFASGCLFHKPAHAVAVVIVGTMLVCFLPIVFPPLERFEIGGVLDETALEYAVVSSLVGIAVLMLVFALLSVRFHWHIESGKPLIYGAICSGFLVLALSASYQLGTNLPVISTTELPKGEVADFADVGKTSTGVNLLPVGQNGEPVPDGASHLLTLSNDSLGLGAVQIQTRQEFWSDWSATLWTRNEHDRSIVYHLHWGKGEQDNPVRQLAVVRDAGIGSSSVMADTDLWAAPHARGRARLGDFDQFGNRLFVIAGSRLTIFDLSDPPHPRRISDEAFPWELDAQDVGGNVVVPLPPVPGMPAEERLKFMKDIINAWGGWVFDGTTLYRFSANTFDVLRLLSFDNDRALFQRAGKYTPTIVQSISVPDFAGNRRIVNGMVYLTSGNRLSVFDATGDGPVKLTAHFTAPGVRFFQVLPDGRVIAGGSKIWVLGAPKR